MRFIRSKALGSCLAYSLLVAHLVAITWFALDRPIYTWDLVPYVATTLTAESGDPAAIHEATYELLRQSLDAAQFNSLIGGEYAAAMYASPENFASQLSMYEIKPLYVLLLRGLAATGANPVDGIIWLSLVPGLLFCVILFLWLRNLTGPMQAVLAVILFSVGARLFDLSRVPTPDNLSALAVLAGVWFLLARRWTAAAVICLGLSIWIRTNNIIFVAPLLLLLCWNHLRRGEPLRSEEFYWYGGGLAFSALSYLGISAAFDYDWWRLYHHTLIQPIVDLQNFSTAFSWDRYFEVQVNAALQLISLDPDRQFLDTSVLLFLLLWMVAWAGISISSTGNVIRPMRPVDTAETALLCLPVFAATLLLFPLISGLDRLLTAYYAIITMFAASTFSGQSGAVR